MIKSKAWNWQMVSESDSKKWREPAMEAYYLLNRWQGKSKNSFLDLGCGLGRHSILFAKNGFETYAFDLSAEGVKMTK